MILTNCAGFFARGEFISNHNHWVPPKSWQKMDPSRSVLRFPIRTEFILLLALGLLPWGAAGTQTCSEVAVCNFHLMGEVCSANLTRHSCSEGIRLSVNESNSKSCVWTGKVDNSSARQMPFGRKDHHSWNMTTSDILMHAQLTFIVSCFYRGVVFGSITFFLFRGIYIPSLKCLE